MTPNPVGTAPYTMVVNAVEAALCIKAVFMMPCVECEKGNSEKGIFEGDYVEKVIRKKVDK